MTSNRDMNLTEQDLDMDLRAIMLHAFIFKTGSPLLTHKRYKEIFKDFENKNYELSDDQKSAISELKFSYGFGLFVKKDNRELEEKLREFIKDDNFFIKPASERLEILQNLRKNDVFMATLMKHKQDAKIFLKESLDNNPDLLNQIARNRLGLNILGFSPSHVQPQRNNNQQERKIEHKGEDKAHQGMRRYGQFHMHGIRARRAQEFLVALISALREARHRPAARHRQAPLAVPDAAAVGITQILENHKIEIDGLDDFRCPLSRCCIVGKVYRVQNGDSTTPHYQYYDKEMLDTEFKAQTATIKTDPLTKKPLKDSDIVDGTEQYRKEFMEMVEKNLKDGGMPADKISEALRSLRKEFFGEELKPSPGLST